MDCNTKGSRRDDFPLQGDLGFCKELAVIGLFFAVELVWLVRGMIVLSVLR